MVSLSGGRRKEKWAMFHQGPSFLKQTEEFWPKNNVATRPNAPAVAENAATTTTTTTNKSSLLENESSDHNGTNAIQFAITKFVRINENLNNKKFVTTTTTTTNKSLLRENERDKVRTVAANPLLREISNLAVLQKRKTN